MLRYPVSLQSSSADANKTLKTKIYGAMNLKTKEKIYIKFKLILSFMLPLIYCLQKLIEMKNR